MSDASPAIELANVGLRREERWILRGVNWRVEPGCCAAILGPNGSGKSTLARIIACYLWPSEGESVVLGNRFGEANLPEVRRGIRLVQPAGPYDLDPELTAHQAVLTGFFSTIGLYDPVTGDMEAEAAERLRQVGLHRVSDHAYRTLSSGERVRCLIARALVHHPKLLLLDEPTSGLDLLSREQVLATVQMLFDGPMADGGGPPTVVFITHHIEELPPATSRVLLLDDGRAAGTGSPAEVLREEILSAVYRCPVQVRCQAGRYSVSVHPDAWRGLLGP